MTRKEYINSNGASHRAYYAQFVTPALQAAIVDRIGANAIIASTDEYMNDIPIGRWDALEPITKHHAQKLLRDIGGDFWSLGCSVCIAKEAARLWKEAV